jgi:hypothetical protein
MSTVVVCIPTIADRTSMEARMSLGRQEREDEMEPSLDELMRIPRSSQEAGQ